VARLGRARLGNPRFGCTRLDAAPVGDAKLLGDGTGTWRAGSTGRGSSLLRCAPTGMNWRPNLNWTKSTR